MSNGKEKVLREGLTKQHASLTDSTERGSFAVRGADNGTIDITNMDEFRQAVESGANGKVVLDGGDDGLFTMDLENWRGATEDEYAAFKVASGKRAVSQLLDGAVAKMERNADNRGFFDVFSEKAIETVTPDNRTGVEKLQSEITSERRPVPSTLGPIGVGAVVAGGAGLALGGAAAGAGLGARTALAGGQVLAESAISESGIATAENRQFQVENMVRDVATAGGLFGAGKAIKVGRSALKSAMSARSAAGKFASDTAKLGSEFGPEAVKAGKFDESLKAAESIIEQAGGDASAAKWLRRNKKAVKAAGPAVDKHVASLAKEAKNMAGVEKAVRTAWSKAKGNIKVPKTAMGKLKQPLRSLNDAANDLASRAGTAEARGVASNIASDVENLLKNVKKKKISPSQAQEAVNNISTTYFGKTSDVEVNSLVAGLRDLKKNPEVFGDAGILRQQVDEIVSGMNELAPSLRNGDVDKLLKSNLAEGAFQVRREAAAMAKALDDLNSLGVLGDEASSFLKVSRGIEKSLDDAMGTAAAPGPMRIMSLANSVKEGVKTAKQGWLDKVKDSVGPAVLAGAGGAVGGPGGAALGLFIGRVDAARNLVGTAAQAAVSAGRATINAGAKATAATLKNPAASGTALGVVAKSSLLFSDKKKEAFESLREELSLTANDPHAMLQELEPFGEMANEMPGDEGVEFVLSIANAKQHLYATMPGKDGGPVSDAELDQYLGRVDVVQNPMMALDHLQAGTFDSAMRNSLLTVYPGLFMEMGGLVLYNTGDDLETLPYQSKIRLSNFLGLTVDPTLAPSYISVAQNRGAQTQQQDQAINGQRNSPLPNQIAQMQQTTAERLANK